MPCVSLMIVVGREIEAWEKVRPEQPDQKTGELVNFLLVYRTHRLSPR